MEPERRGCAKWLQTAGTYCPMDAYRLANKRDTRSRDQGDAGRTDRPMAQDALLLERFHSAGCIELLLHASHELLRAGRC